MEGFPSSFAEVTMNSLHSLSLFTLALIWVFLDWSIRASGFWLIGSEFWGNKFFGLSLMVLSGRIEDLWDIRFKDFGLFGGVVLTEPSIKKCTSVNKRKKKRNQVVIMKEYRQVPAAVELVGYRKARVRSPCSFPPMITTWYTEWFFHLILFVGYILSFSLVRLWTVWLLVQVFTLVRGGSDNHECHNENPR